MGGRSSSASACAAHFMEGLWHLGPRFRVFHNVYGPLGTYAGGP